MTADTEEIVYVTRDGIPTGEVGPKLASHHMDTGLHLGFSCYIFRLSDQAFLASRRALTKKVWPGVWTNSVCGHPGPGEPWPDAVRRRADRELGLRNLIGLQCLIPDYIYRTPPFNGIIENEFCPIFAAFVDEEPDPAEDEVADVDWMKWGDYEDLMESDSPDVSYWAKDQLTYLKRRGKISRFLLTAEGFAGASSEASAHPKAPIHIGG